MKFACVLPTELVVDAAGSMVDNEPTAGRRTSNSEIGRQQGQAGMRPRGKFSPMPMSELLFKVRGISLKWKILIPFLTLAFLGTASLTFVGLNSQNDLLRKEELKEIRTLYRIFLAALDQKLEQTLVLAGGLAADPVVGKCLAERDAEGLYRHLFPVYKRWKRDFDIRQLHFQVPPGKSFLRVHNQALRRELISYRNMVLEAMKGPRAVGGLEWGLTGLSIRGVVPVFWKGALAGTVEVGHPFDLRFMQGLKRKWNADFSVHEVKGPRDYRLLVTTRGDGRTMLQQSPDPSYRPDKTRILISPPGWSLFSVILGPLRDYRGDVVAVVEICLDRSGVLKRLSRARVLMAVVGGGSLLLSFLFTWVVAALFVRPIKEIVGEAEEIAQGKRESLIEQRPPDEIGALTQALNTLLESLNQKQREVEHYARTLEARVKQRTADLVASEEKYRALVENLPLIVYRVLRDGTTEFINPYFTEKLGYTTEEVVGDRKFWKEKICGKSQSEKSSALEPCWEEGREMQTEREVRSKDGRLLTFIDYAIPHREPDGRVSWVEGIMMDITELKRLQERALRTEEMRILGEVSARFAHEIRNPLVAAGGFARRLRDALPEDHPQRKFADIIVEEVARLEEILRICLASIKPLTLNLTPVDMGRLLRAVHEELNEQIGHRRIDLMESFPKAAVVVMADEVLMARAFENLLKQAVLAMPEGDRLVLQMAVEEGRAVIDIRYRAGNLSEEDLEQFFFPRFTSEAGAEVLDLPLSKMIIHRHGGKIEVSREEESGILVRVELPAKS